MSAGTRSHGREMAAFRLRARGSTLDAMDRRQLVRALELQRRRHDTG
jgi:hypothetical protein